MANFKIMRNGLNTEIVGDPHIGQSSEDVTVTVTDDGTYQEYDKKLYYSYGYRNQIYRAIADKNSSGEFIIPMTAFLEPGIVKLSLELSNGTNKPTCNACFLTVTNGAKDINAAVLPSEKTWQEYVDSYLAKARQSALNDIDSQREFAVSGITKIGTDTLSSISAKAASATKDIDNKANDAIVIIPSDYASLTSKVSSLKLYRDDDGYLCEEE